MNNHERYFPKTKRPQIYVYSLTDPRYKGILKVGHTNREDAEIRIKEQFTTLNQLGKFFNIEHTEPSIRDDGSVFIDDDVHDKLEEMGFEKQTTKNSNDSEFFKCTLDDVKKAILAVKTNSAVSRAMYDFGSRPEQGKCKTKTYNYFHKPGNDRRFLWNAKMRFGKTYTSYKLAQEMEWKRVLVLTFKPGVQDSWKEDLLNHKDFLDWDFTSRDYNPERKFTKDKFVCFGSFQDFLGTDEEGNVKSKNQWVHETKWDVIILDEYHFGAWKERAMELSIIGGDDIDDEEYDINFKPEDMPIKTDYYLYLSGTPFRSLSSGEFIEDQIFTWSYSDEQAAKKEWKNSDGPNPYRMLPEMVMLTYKLPDSITNNINDEYNEFNLNEFFAADSKKKEFKHKNEVQNWLNVLHNAFSIKNIGNPTAETPPLPYADSNLQDALTHTLWFLPGIAACDAMEKMLKKDLYFREFNIVNASGSNVPDGAKAKIPVDKAIKNHTKTITLTTGKLTTGVTIPQWSGIFMLRNLNSPETYFQSAFRVQSPWVIKDEHGKEQILKEKCYVFDFSPNRALRQVKMYSSELDPSIDRSIEEKVQEFTKFLPILAYDGAVMKELDPREILDIATSGTSSTLLAKKWQSALLVNLDSITLKNIMNSEDALEAIMKIEGFRAIGTAAMETLINKTEVLKKLRTKEKEKTITIKEKKELTDAEKQVKGIRKQIQEKLITFATRIPIFMFLTDYREEKLKDVITKLDTALFKKVTNLTVEDFNLLLSYNLFNSELMNESIADFRRYEDSSLSYTGINLYDGNKKLGLFDTVVGNFIPEERKNKQNIEETESKKKDGFINKIFKRKGNS
jgi:hypothetical protein